MVQGGSRPVPREARRRLPPRFAWTVVALTAAAALTLLFVLRAPRRGDAQARPAAVVESTVGTVWVRGTDTPVSRFLVADYAIPVGSGLRSSADGRASLRLSSGHSLKLDKLTQIRLLADGRVALDGGRIYVDPGDASEGSAQLTVTTPFGAVRGVGMQVEVHLRDNGMRVLVREGAVEVLRAGGDRRVTGGNELRIDPEGTLSQREIVTDEPEQDWSKD